MPFDLAVPLICPGYAATASKTEGFMGVTAAIFMAAPQLKS
jgi:hypothetical protein